MAISKILYISSSGSKYAGHHLKKAINYIKDPDKTDGGMWVSALNCQPESAYEQMRSTKQLFGKTDKRQGYHLIISFNAGEVDGKTAFEVIGRFAKEYLGNDFEAVYSVHNNTEHVHGHIIYNSVSFRTGRKYRYEKGDWAEKIQPITNRLCEEYGLSTIEISEDRMQPSENYKEWNDFRDGKFVWSDMIKRDLDFCILRAGNYEEFLGFLADLGYSIKNRDRCEGKYLAIKPMGLTRFRRCKSLGEDYSEERIRERIASEKLSSYQREIRQKPPGIRYCRIKKYRRAKLSGLQKDYFARMYRCGKLKKRPYSQVWVYRDEIRKMQKLQEEYLFLVRHDVQTASGVTMVANNLADKKLFISREKSKVYKKRERMKSLFELTQELRNLQEMENVYQNGDVFFEMEHMRYMELSERLKKSGYTVAQVEELRQHYTDEIIRVKDLSKEVEKEKRIAERILKEIQRTDSGKQKEEQEKEKHMTQENWQPIR